MKVLQRNIRGKLPFGRIINNRINFNLRLPAPASQCKDVIIAGGRGFEASLHHGNVKFRALIYSLKDKYSNSCKRDKPHVAAGVVRAVRAQNPPGRCVK